jgi:exosortase
VALVLVLQGIALCTLGWKTYRSQLPVMLLLFLMIPCGDILLPLLRGLTVKWIEWFALLTGLPHSVEGYVIYIGEHRYIVIDLCAGLTFFTLAGFLGYSFGLLLFRSLSKVMAMAALGAALGILTNAMRVCLIVGIDWLRGSQMDLAAHQDIQWLVLLTALGLLVFLASRLEQDSWTTAQVYNPEGKPVWHAGRFGPALAGALVLASVGLVQGLAYRTDGTGTANVESLQQLADRYPGSRWLATADTESQYLSIPYPKAMEVVLITPGSVTGRLVKNGINPENGRIWRHTDTRRYRECLGDSCITFVHTTWKRKNPNDTRHTFYTYYVGDMVTDSKLAFRLARGWNRLAGSPNAAGLIAFKLSGDIPPEYILSSVFQELRDGLNATASNTLVSSAG